MTRDHLRAIVNRSTIARLMASFGWRVRNFANDNRAEAGERR